jgi:hypothetical protein
VVPRKAGHTNDFDYRQRAESRNPFSAVLLHLRRSSLVANVQLEDAYLEFR